MVAVVMMRMVVHVMMMRSHVNRRVKIHDRCVVLGHLIGIERIHHHHRRVARFTTSITSGMLLLLILHEIWTIITIVIAVIV